MKVTIKMENKFIEDLFEGFARHLDKISNGKDQVVELSVREEDYKAWIDSKVPDYVISVKGVQTPVGYDAYTRYYGVGYKVKFKNPTE